MTWGYILSHPEILFGVFLLTVCIISGAIWSGKVITAKMKYTYEKEKDEAWQKEHAKRVKADKRCDELVSVAQTATKNYKIAMLTLRRIERTRIENGQANQQKAN